MRLLYVNVGYIVLIKIINKIINNLYKKYDIK
jgi:hypothetical protein